jgi:hypothetical protein
LYAAVLDPRIRRVALEGMLVSYTSVVEHRVHRQIFEQVVPSALKYFDLPGLVGSLAPRPVWIVNPVDGLGRPVSVAEVQKDYSSAVQAFQTAGTPVLHLTERRPSDPLLAVYSDLIRVAAGGPTD